MKFNPFPAPLPSRLLLLLGLAFPSATFGVTTFVENFDSNASNWRDAGGLNPLAWNADGGPSGVGDGYVTTTFSFQNSAADNTAVMFRGHDGYNSSADSFVGNWVADGVSSFSVWVRHDAPQPLNYFTRLASSMNFPGGTAIQVVPVAPNTWTEISVAITDPNPQFVTFEGSSFAGVFSSIGNIQLGISVPASIAGDPATYHFDVDRVGITVPEPAGAALASLGFLVLFRRRRNRSQP